MIILYGYSYDDYSYVLDEIQNYDLSLYYVSSRLRNNQNIVMAAVRRNGSYLEYASNRLKNYKSVVITAVKQNSFSLQFASKKLKGNKDIVLTAVKDNGYNMQYASLRLQNDRDVVLTAINNFCGYNYYLLQYISDDIKNLCLSYSLNVTLENIKYIIEREKHFYLLTNNRISNLYNVGFKYK